MSCPLKSRLILLNTAVKYSIKAFGFAHNLSDSYTLPMEMEYTTALLEIKYRTWENFGVGKNWRIW